MSIINRKRKELYVPAHVFANADEMIDCAKALLCPEDTKKQKVVTLDEAMALIGALQNAIVEKLPCINDYLNDDALLHVFLYMLKTKSTSATVLPLVCKRWRDLYADMEMKRFVTHFRDNSYKILACLMVYMLEHEIFEGFTFGMEFSNHFVQTAIGADYWEYEVVIRYCKENTSFLFKIRPRIPGGMNPNAAQEAREEREEQLLDDFAEIYECERVYNNDYHFAWNRDKFISFLEDVQDHCNERDVALDCWGENFHSDRFHIDSDEGDAFLCFFDAADYLARETAMSDFLTPKATEKLAFWSSFESHHFARLLFADCVSDRFADEGEDFKKCDEVFINKMVDHYGTMWVIPTSFADLLLDEKNPASTMALIMEICHDYGIEKTW